MKYSQADARHKAQMVVDQVGLLILAAVTGTTIDPAFLAGKIGVEAGVRGGKIVQTATRFEAGVYQDLKSLRDNGWCIVSGKKVKSYSGVKREQIADATEQALRALATSYGLSQIMGWHMINNLKGKISDLRDPSKNLVYTIQLMRIVAGTYLKAKNYEACLRIWNTGRPQGKTYDPNYVHNALLVMEFAAPLLEKLKSRTPDAGSQAGGGGVLADIGADDFEPDENDLTDHEDSMEPDENQTAPEPPAPAKEDAPKNDPQTVDMTAPAETGTFRKKIGRWWQALGFGVPTGAGVLAMIQSSVQDGHVDWKEVLQITVTTFVAVLPYVTAIIIAVVLYKIINTAMIQHSFNKRMEINGNPDLNNIKIKQPSQPAALTSGASLPLIQIKGWSPF